jgi:hypothetical protein
MRKWISLVLVAALVSAIVGIGTFVAAPSLSAWLGVPATAIVNLPSHPSATSEDKPRVATTSTSPGDPWWVSLAGKIAWPMALLIALGMIGWNSRLRRIFGTGTRLVRKVSAGGVVMEINAEAVDEVRDKLRASFRELVSSARDEFERMADLQDLDRHLEAVVESALLPKIAGGRPAGLRATIHVRDIVFRDYLYQLVDYYPLGGGAHRRFSLRYGIIGRSWRTGKSHGTGNAFGTLASTETLVEEWGMTRDETHGVLNPRPSCLSVLLRVDTVPVGIVYIDATARDAFGDTKTAQKLVAALEIEPLVVKLAVAVERTLTPLRVGGPNLDLKELGR